MDSTTLLNARKVALISALIARHHNVSRAMLVQMADDYMAVYQRARIMFENRSTAPLDPRDREVLLGMLSHVRVLRSLVRDATLTK